MAPAYTAFPFPKALFEKFVLENEGGTYKLEWWWKARGLSKLFAC
jgi:hypothetical protein